MYVEANNKELCVYALLEIQHRRKGYLNLI